jgi:hypothetical protein
MPRKFTRLAAHLPRRPLSVGGGNAHSSVLCGWQSIDQNWKPMTKARKKSSRKTVKPGERAPASGVYEVVGPRGTRTGDERTVVRGQPLPPIPKSRQSYTLRAKSGRYIITSGKVSEFSYYVVACLQEVGCCAATRSLRTQRFYQLPIFSRLPAYFSRLLCIHAHTGLDARSK